MDPQRPERDSNQTLRSQTCLITGLLIAAAVQTLIIAIPSVPLGISGEWVWERLPWPTSLMAAAAQFVPAIAGATALICVAELGNRLFRQRQTIDGHERRSRRRIATAAACLMLFLLVFGMWTWLKTVERCAPAPHRHLKSLWVLYDPSSSGYFYEAAFRIKSTSHFLSSYEERIQEGEVYHVGTHPPGLFVLSRWIVQLCRNVPLVSAWLYDWIFLHDLKAFHRLESEAQLEPPLNESQTAALFLLSELTTLAAALTVVPLFLTLRLYFSVLAAWRATCLWTTVPCLVVFLPKSDVLFTLTSMATVSLGLTALESSRTMLWRLCCAVTGGLVLWCGLMLSLAHLPVLALLSAVALVRFARHSMVSRESQLGHSIEGKDNSSPRNVHDIGLRRNSVIRRDLSVIAVIVATAATLTLIFSVATDCNMLSVWRMNLRNHAAFYDVHTRTAWKWLMINPLELGMSVGLPLALSALVGLRHVFAAHRRNSTPDFVPPTKNPSQAVALTVALLWISCRNSGESARLWCFLTPWLMVLPACLVGIESNTPDRDVERSPSINWHVLLLSQMAVCILTSSRVTGFSF